MKRLRTLVVVAVLSSFLFTSCGSSIPFLGPSMDMINGLTALGVSPEQAVGGVGALLTLTKGKLNPSDFMKVTGAIPYANTMMKSAQDMGVPMSISNLAGVDKVFKDLDMSPDMVAKFIPEMTKFAGKKGGDDVTNLLMGALK